MLPFAQDVFRTHDQVADSRAVTTFQQNRQMTAADFFQEREILHIARPDLEAVGVFFDQGQIARVHDLGDDGQTGLPPRFG